MYTQSGTYAAIAGILVSVLGHFGISSTVDDLAQVIGAVIVIVGIVRQAIAHKNLATVAGHR